MDAIYEETYDCSYYEHINLALQLVENEAFRVAFFCSSLRHAEYTAEKLKHLIGDECYVRRLSAGHYEFIFSNHSSILVKVPSDHTHGYRIHAMFVEYGIFDNVVKNCLLPCLCNYETR